MKTLWILLAVCVAAVTIAGPVNAQTEPLTFSVTVEGHSGDIIGAPSDHFLTFNAPVQIPGVSLAPGAYVFRFITRDVVQVLNADRSLVYAMFLTIPASRGEMSDQYGMKLQRVRDDTPPRITHWFLPNQWTGFEIIYPKEPEAITFVAMK